MLIPLPVFAQDDGWFYGWKNDDLEKRCFQGDTWGQIDRCIAEGRMNEFLSTIVTPLWVIGGIVFVLLIAWLMFRRFKSKSTQKNMNTNFEQKKVMPTRNSFCGNCGNAVKNKNFCPKCGSIIKSDIDD